MELRLVKFGATWCGMCKAEAKEFKKEIYNNISYIEYDADECGQDILDKYMIKSLPVIILEKKVNDSYEVLHRWNGFTKINLINEYLKGIQ